MDLIASDEVEVYVHPAKVDSVVADFALAESRNPNVVARVPPEPLWLFDSQDAPWPVVVVDLLDARDDRSVRAAHELAKRMRPQ